MKIHCPHCGVKGSAEDSYAGRKVKCPKCQGIFEVLPEMASEITDETLSGAAYSSTPIESAAAEAEIAPPIPEEDSLGDIEKEDTVSDSMADSLEQPEPDEDLSKTDSAQQLAAEEVQEDTLDWEDIASDEDLQLAGDEPEEAEEILQESPAEAQPLYDESLDKVEDPEPLVAEQGETVTESEPEAIEASRDTGTDEADDLAEVLAEDDKMEDFSLPEEADEVVEEPADEGLEESEEDVADLEGVADTDLQTEDLAEEEIQLAADADEVELEPYGIDKEQCWQCGKEASADEPFTDQDGRLFCSECVSLESPELAAVAPLAEDEGEGPTSDDTAQPESPVSEGVGSLSIGGAIREAWARTKGAKGTIWAASAMMYLVVLIVVAGGAFLLPSMVSGPGNVNALLANGLLQVINSVLSVLFTAGLLLIGIRKVAGEEISWKMIFKGFSCAGSLIVATILQFLVVSIGLLLLVLPGIYLAVGYTMSIPLIIDKGLSPWQALETSRKAVHKVWWKVTGIYIVMALIYLVSLVPLGIGIIWTWPMFIILAGVLYHYLFSGAAEASIVEEDKDVPESE